MSPTTTRITMTTMRIQIQEANPSSACVGTVAEASLLYELSHSDVLNALTRYLYELFSQADVSEYEITSAPTVPISANAHAEARHLSILNPSSDTVLSVHERFTLVVSFPVAVKKPGAVIDAFADAVPPKPDSQLHSEFLKNRARYVYVVE